MKKFLLWLLTLIITLPAGARDFSYSYSGKTLTYEVLDEYAKTCAVKTGNQVSGALEIPASASDGSNNYSVIELQNMAFFGCSDLTSVKIPTSITSIGNVAFFKCSSLTSVTIPYSVVSLGRNTFAMCTGLRAINVDAASNSFSSVNGVLFNKSKDTILVFPCNGASSYTIPSTVTSIEEYAFNECSGLNSITIPNSVTQIGTYAFCNCTNLTSVKIPDSVTSMGNKVFMGCNNLTSVYLSNALTAIDEYTFYNCGLKSVTIPNSVISIGSSAFGYCRNLATVKMSDSVTSIGDYAFYNCGKLESINLSNSLTSIGNYAFDSCDKLLSITLPKSVSTIGAHAFSCSDLQSVSCLAEVPPVCDKTAFSTFPVSLRVFENSVELYRQAEGWKNFDIYGYYKVCGPNDYLYIDNSYVHVSGYGQYISVFLHAEDTNEYDGCNYITTDIYLPEGITAATDATGKIDVQVGNTGSYYDPSNAASATIESDGAIRVVVVPQNFYLHGYNDVLFHLQIKKTFGYDSSTPKPVWLRNTVFKFPNNECFFNDVNPHIDADGVMGGADVEVDASAPAVYYNLQGVRVAQPERGGVYICVQGGKASKIVF